MNQNNLSTADFTNFIHSIIKPHLFAGAVCADMTAGRGRDSLFMLKNTEPDGIVYAFDIQKEAVRLTSELLKKHGISQCRYKVLKRCHSETASILPSPPDIIIYNLGYLPGGDKTKTTLAPTTIKSIKQSCGIVNPGGIISIAIYKGHPEGMTECENIKKFAQTLNTKTYKCVSMTYLNAEATAPEYLLIQKIQKQKEI